jgi:predicted DNA-binding transcriptional regulator YafY
MYDPSMRVLTVLELLQARESIAAKELAATLEVSGRTLQRYIMRLQDLGVPVSSSKGPGARYRLRPGFRLPPMMLGLDEAFALMLGLEALTQLGLGNIAPANAVLRAKFERVLPESIRQRLATTRAALLLDAPPTTADANVQVLLTLAEAIQQQCCVQFQYRSRHDDHTNRVVEPYGVMQRGGCWYLAAYCRLRRGMRLFRVDRIAKLEPHQARFAVPADFDLPTFVQNNIVFAPYPWYIEVWLEMPREQVASQISRSLATFECEGTGTVLCSGATNLEWMAALLLQLGCRLEIRTPLELHSAFAAVAARALEVAQQTTSG